MILPKRKPKKTAENRVETKWEKIKRILKETAGTMSGGGDVADARRRQEQFTGYMKMIDQLQNTKANLRGRIQLGNLEARSGKIGTARVTKMSTIMDNYHDKSLRMAQAKYYQKQLG